MAKSFSKQALIDGFDQLDQLARQEYGKTVIEILTDSSDSDDLNEARLRRLTGILLKMPFAYRTSIDPSYTKAIFAWNWHSGDEWDRALADESNASELDILESLVQVIGSPPNLSENQRWDKFRGEVDHERGLFKVMALWVRDRMDGGRERTWTERLNADETRQFTTALDTVTLISQVGITTALSPLVPSAGIVVGMSLIIAKWGYARFADAGARPDNDY